MKLTDLVFIDRPNKGAWYLRAPGACWHAATKSEAVAKMFKAVKWLLDNNNIRGYIRTTDGSVFVINATLHGWKYDRVMPDGTFCSETIAGDRRPYAGFRDYVQTIASHYEMEN